MIAHLSNASNGSWRVSFDAPGLRKMSVMEVCSTHFSLISFRFTFDAKPVLVSSCFNREVMNILLFANYFPRWQRRERKFMHIIVDARYYKTSQSWQAMLGMLNNYGTYERKHLYSWKLLLSFCELQANNDLFSGERSGNMRWTVNL